MSRHEVRAAIATEFGATEVVGERGDDAVARLHAVTDGLGVDVALECVGTDESMRTALQAVRPGGRVGFVGVPHDVSVPIEEMFGRNIRIGGGVAPVRATLPMLLGALVGAALPNDDTIAGMGTLTHGVTTGIFIVFAVGVAATNSMDLYCGSLSTITIGQNIFPRWQPRAISRAITAVVLFAVAIVPAIFSADDFLANYANFLALLLCVLIPWTAINLVDYYVLRHGDYDIPSLFERDGGVYGTFNWTAIACYFIGIVIQIPFLSTTLFTGFAAEAINGVDISWLVGLAVICPLYYVLMRPQFQESAEPAAEPA